MCDSLARIGDEELLFLRAIGKCDQNAGVFDGPNEMLPAETNTNGRRRRQLMLQADGELLLLHRFQFRIDQIEIGGIGRMSEVDVLNERCSVTCRTLRDGVRDSLAVERQIIRVVQIERSVDPFLTAERAAGQFHLHDVVKPAVTSIRLCAAVSADVIREAEAGGELVAKAPVHGVVSSDTFGGV